MSDYRAQFNAAVRAEALLAERDFGLPRDAYVGRYAAALQAAYDAGRQSLRDESRVKSPPPTDLALRVRALVCCCRSNCSVIPPHHSALCDKLTDDVLAFAQEIRSTERERWTNSIEQQRQVMAGLVDAATGTSSEWVVKRVQECVETIFADIAQEPAQ